MKTLRPYQEAAINSIFDWFSTGNMGNPIVVAPVGAGKSLMIAALIKRIHEQTPRTRICVISHVKELLTQNADELRGFYQECDYGFYCAGLGQKRLHNDVTFASIQSIYTKINDFNRAPQILIVDECHLISHNDQTQYRKFIDDCKALNTNCVVIGFTGTDFRSDSGRLDEGEGKLFDGVCYEIPIKWMIENGYLCKPFTPKVKTIMNVEGVQARNGDYVQGQLEKAVDVDETTKACVDEIISEGQDRHKWLAFTAGITHCEHVFEELKSRGVDVSMLTGDTPKTERDEIIKWFKQKSDKPKCLVNVAVLTTGFNVPEIDLIAFMRPTRSPVLYIQCIGRGMRPVYAIGHNLETTEDRLNAIQESTKKDCKVLDFGQVVATLGPIDEIEGRKKQRQKVDGERTAVIKRCPACNAECAPSQRYCYVCSYSFISANLEIKASDASLLSSDNEPVWEDVVYMKTYLHKKKNNEMAKPTMRVAYSLIDREVSEYVCFEHDGFAGEKAAQWHFSRLKDQPCPETVENALMVEYPPPKKILVKQEGKYERVIGYEFDEKPKYEFKDEIPF